MKLTIKEPMPNGKTANSYEIVVTTYQGDGDGDVQLVLGPFHTTDLELLEDALLTLDRVAKAFPQGMGGQDDFNHIEGFTVWFDDIEYLDDPDFVVPEGIARTRGYDNWPSDPMSDYTSPNSYSGHKVFYYDAEKTVHYVDFEI